MPTTLEDRLVVGDVSVVPDMYRQHGAFIHTINRELVGAAADRLTQQVFTEAWRDRSSFNPSLGTVRNWLVRRARARVSKTSPEAERAVDRLVVADSLHRMDELHRQVVVAGFDASDADSLARRLDQPVATIRANLRRGTDQLKSDLAESRADGEDSGLIDIMTDGPPNLELVTPPEVVWQAIAAELNLDTGAVTTDDFNRLAEATSGGDAEAPATVEEAAGEPDIVDGDRDPDGPDSDDRHDGDPDRDESGVAEVESDADVVAQDGEVQSVDQLREPAEATELDRPSWIAPAVVAVALVILIVLMLTAL